MYTLLIFTYSIFNRNYSVDVNNYENSEEKFEKWIV